ncbi:metallophosphatase family protein [Aestuariirhabdus sp. Z084]|uniref:metallophosphoesterase family protein n=1 Tax=Aestuariirhabdus haliotis TaxID=2918751 RepID=UPI00201B3A7C|nr:metallophosphoesterase family protein [Aestuariirhabdus haliotis]MCL6417519.1 metallophosphatase family protein [Aestuariirhabdus haliotis]MCL6421469.1 metallophosphatase family protein [Aestuariirhabdus haliotis]
MLEKIAILSDIHSNIFALEAVINHARANGATTFINLGDILYGPIAPRKTYERLQSLNALTLSGNQDRQIYEATPDEIDANPTMAFILQDLGQEPLHWMKSLPFDLHITPEIYACHGTPTNDLIYLLEDVSSGSATVRTDQKILSLLGDVCAPIILCGHSHTPRCIELSTGQCVINPGSVGLQAYTDEEPVVHSMQNYSSHASYATLQRCNNSPWDIAFHRVSYDVHSAIQAAQSRNRDDWVHYLTTGRH